MRRLRANEFGHMCRAPDRYDALHLTIAPRMLAQPCNFLAGWLGLLPSEFSKQCWKKLFPVAGPDFVATKSCCNRKYRLTGAAVMRAQQPTDLLAQKLATLFRPKTITFVF